MELMAAISALEALKRALARRAAHRFRIRAGTASAPGSTAGSSNGWKTADKKPVKNVELWQRLDAARQRHEVHWHWVKGHAGHAENERADELAREGVAPC